MGRFSSFTASIGRILFALIFLAAGAQKFQTFDAHTGGPATEYAGPKIDHFFGVVRSHAGYDIPLEKLLFIAVVTPIMHNWWDIAPGPQQQLEFVMFMKNISLLGALFHYLGAKGLLRSAKRQLKAKAE